MPFQQITAAESVDLMTPPKDGQTVCSVTYIDHYVCASGVISGDFEWSTWPVMKADHLGCQIVLTHLFANSTSISLNGREFFLDADNEVIEVWQVETEVLKRSMIMRIERTVDRQREYQSAGNQILWAA